MIALKIRPQPPRTSPQQNGKVERGHWVDQEEFWDRHDFGSHDEAARALPTWEHAYNHTRSSMALAGKTPVEKLASKLPLVAAS